MGKVKKMRQNVVPGGDKKQVLLFHNGKSEEVVSFDGKYYYTKQSQYRKNYAGMEVKELPKEVEEDEAEKG